MKTIEKTKKSAHIKVVSIAISLFFLLLNNTSSAEGTKEFRPDSAYYGNMQINDQGRPFALESNSDPLYRLYFHIEDCTKEKVYIGFNHIKAAYETCTYRIMNPDGTQAKARANIPTSGTGLIKYYSQAVAGPKISNLPANGYTPIVFTPFMNGDFYLEFTTSYQGTNTAYHFDLFDLTVATSTATRIKGRLWSYCWDLNTRSYTNRYWGNFYSYSDDGYVTEFNMNGIQPYGFTVSCNNSGPTLNDRKSVDGNSTRPQYKIFLNDPDILCYPSGETPVIIENLTLVDTPFVGQPAMFTIKMSKAGIFEMVFELNGIPGYQPNSEDVIIVKTVTTNVIDTLVWDGKDGLRNIINADKLVTSSADFYCGVTHFPLYDPETNEYGYIVNRVRPVAGPCKIYWDDSNFPGGTTNITGQYGPAHTWPYFFGDVRTMNTWWDGFRLDTIATFEWNFLGDGMPVEFIEVNAAFDINHVDVSWKTASETNNDFFTVERSEDGISFAPIAIITGAGNSNSTIEYNYKDSDPINGIGYYRIKQTDYDGNFNYSPVIRISSDNDKSDEIHIFSTGSGIAVCANAETSINPVVTIYNMSGQTIYTTVIAIQEGASYSLVTPEIEMEGLFLVCITSENQVLETAKIFF